MELFAIVSGFLVTGVVVVGLMAWQRHLKERWRQVARDHGLQWHEGSLLEPSSMSGEVHGVRLSATTVSRSSGKSSSTCSTSRSWSGPCTAWSPSASTAGSRTAWSSSTSSAWRWTTSCGRSTSPPTWPRPWGMRATPPGGTFEITGTMRGVPMHLRSDRSGTKVRTRVPGGLPEGMTIAQGEGGIHLVDPVLDPMLEVEAADRVAATRFFAVAELDDLRGDLLAVLHGFPGSRVHDDMVELVAPGQPARRVDEMAEAACALAISLGRAASPRGTPPSEET